MFLTGIGVVGHLLTTRVLKQEVMEKTKTEIYYVQAGVPKTSYFQTRIDDVKFWENHKIIPVGEAKEIEEKNAERFDRKRGRK